VAIQSACRRFKRRLSQRLAATMVPVFISAHWLPVASIPPFAPPEQGDDASTVSTFEVFTGALGGGAALASRLAPCADTVDAAGVPNIFTVG